MIHCSSYVNATVSHFTFVEAVVIREAPFGELPRVTVRKTM